MPESLKNIENKDISSQISDFKIKSGAWISALADHFAIKLSKIESKIGNIQEGDKFSLKGNILSKNDKPIATLEKNDFFQETETIPEFPTIKLKKTPQKDGYMILDKSGKDIIAGNPIFVSTANLDNFKKALASPEISGKLIVKAGTYKNMEDLSQEIVPKGPFPTIVSLNGDHFWKPSSTVDLEKILPYTSGNKALKAVDLARWLAATLPLAH